MIDGGLVPLIAAAVLMFAPPARTAIEHRRWVRTVSPGEDCRPKPARRAESAIAIAERELAEDPLMRGIRAVRDIYDRS